MKRQGYIHLGVSLMSEGFEPSTPFQVMSACQAGALTTRPTLHGVLWGSFDYTLSRQPDSVLRRNRHPESMAGMAHWPRSKVVQASIAFVAASLSAVGVLGLIAMDSINHFYFPPYKTYPYPYATVRSAEIAHFGECGLAFLGVFVILYAVQRRFAAKRDA
jgi:hypothetical protein